MMNKDQYFRSLKGRFKDDIQMVIIESQHPEEKYFDQYALQRGLNEVFSFAVQEGLSETDWDELIQEVNPEIYQMLRSNIKAAA
jgi:hypothetical protein